MRTETTINGQRWMLEGIGNGRLGLYLWHPYYNEWRLRWTSDAADRAWMESQILDIYSATAEHVAALVAPHYLPTAPTAAPTPAAPYSVVLAERRGVFCVRARLNRRGGLSLRQRGFRRRPVAR